MDGEPLQDLSAFQRDLLLTLSMLDEPNGQGIKRELEADYDTQLQAGRLYPGLEALEDEGLVDKDENDGYENTYRMTQAGERALLAHVEWVVSRLEN